MGIEVTSTLPGWAAIHQSVGGGPERALVNASFTGPGLKQTRASMQQHGTALNTSILLFTLKSVRTVVFHNIQSKYLFHDAPEGLLFSYFNILFRAELK